MMKRWLKKHTRALFLLVLVCLSGIANAISVATITTPNLSLPIAPGGTATATYTVTNTSGVALADLRFFVPPLSRVDPAGTTCGSTLAVGAACTVRLIIGPKRLVGLLMLDPLGMCAFQGMLCAAANQSQRVEVNFGVPVV